MAQIRNVECLSLASTRCQYGNDSIGASDASEGETGSEFEVAIARQLCGCGPTSCSASGVTVVARAAIPSGFANVEMDEVMAYLLRVADFLTLLECARACGSY